MAVEREREGGREGERERGGEIVVGINVAVSIEVYAVYIQIEIASYH